MNQWRCLGLDFFTNISKPGMNQRMKFDPMAVFYLLKRVKGSDHALGSHMMKKFEKKMDCHLRTFSIVCSTVEIQWLYFL